MVGGVHGHLEALVALAPEPPGEGRTGERPALGDASHEAVVAEHEPRLLGQLHHRPGVEEGPRRGRAAEAGGDLADERHDVGDVAGAAALDAQPPPGRSRRKADRRMAGQSAAGTHCITARVNTASTDPASGRTRSRSCARASTKRWFGSATRRATSSNDGCGSIPITSPSGTSPATMAVKSPEPQPMSTTRSERRTGKRSRKWRRVHGGGRCWRRRARRPTAPAAVVRDVSSHHLRLDSHS